MSASRLIARWKRVLMLGPVQRRSRLEGAVHLGDEPGQVLEVGRGGALGGDARGDDLQPFEQGEDLDDRGARDRRDGGADVRDAQHEPLGLEQAKRLPDRNDAHLELPREVVDDQTRARAELAPDDRLAQRRVDELLLGEVAGARRAMPPA